MTKRFGSFTDNNSKKQKPNGNLDDLWGDDLDAKDVDDCFMLASQVCEKDNIACTQRNNVSILPPYNVFKQTSKCKFTSTQSDPELQSSLHFPSTSKEPIRNGVQKQFKTVTEPTAIKNNEMQVNGFKRTRSFETSQSLTPLQLKIKNLQEQYVAKEGEVSILRGQLKDIRANTESEQSKKQKEWSEKLTATTKQLNAVKSELEFKNLEIANLKQKVLEVAKLNNLDTSINLTQSPFFKKAKVVERCAANPDSTSVASSRKESYNKELKIQPLVETKYPLQNAVPASIFTIPKEEKYLLDFKSNRTCRNTIPFLQNHMSQEVIDRLIRLQPKITILDDNRQLNIDYVYYEMSKLMKCNLQDIESEENFVCINKVLCVSEQLISNLYQFLQELERNTQHQKADVMYLESKFESLKLNQSLFDTKEWCDSEMGINARQSIACISEILPYSNYLRDYLLQKKSLIFKEDEEYLKCLPCVQKKLDKDYSNKFDYLCLITSVVTVIGKLKQSHNFPGLLSGVVVLLTKISLCINIDEIHPHLYNISREIIFGRPNIQVLFHFTEFLKTVSVQNKFVNELCKMPLTKSVLKVNQKERILYYSKDTCVLQVFCIFVEDAILKMENSKMLDLYLNVMKFISNAIKCNPRWLFYQEDKHCDCLCKIVKLWVDVMYQSVEGFPKKRIKFADEVLKHSKILKSLNFKVYDLIVKYVGTYSQYKDVVKSVSDLRSTLNVTESDDELLEDLNITEEIPTVESKTFSNLSLW